MKHWLLILLLIATAGGALAASNDDVLPARFDHPPNQPYSPAEARSKMTVPPGFHVDLVASEPELLNPIAMTFDDRGRIFITESVEYPRKSAGPGRDRIKLIAGVDDLGRATEVGVFAEGFNIPTGVAVGHGGVWVLNSPDLLFHHQRAEDTRRPAAGEDTPEELQRENFFIRSAWLFQIDHLGDRHPVMPRHQDVIGWRRQALKSYCRRPPNQSPLWSSRRTATHRFPIRHIH